MVRGISGCSWSILCSIGLLAQPLAVMFLKAVSPLWKYRRIINTTKCWGQDRILPYKTATKVMNKWNMSSHNEAWQADGGTPGSLHVQVVDVVWHSVVTEHGGELLLEIRSESLDQSGTCRGHRRRWAVKTKLVTSQRQGHFIICYMIWTMRKFRGHKGSGVWLHSLQRPKQ